MKTLIATAVLFVVVPMSASAQNADHYYPWQGYSLFGFGTTTWPANAGNGNPAHYLTEQIAFGGEVISKPGLGLGFEMGWTHYEQYQPRERTPSLDVSFHFPKATHRKIEPFVEAGGTLMYFQTSEGRGSAAANFGGGINYWFLKHVALRCDFKAFRQSIAPDAAGYPNHIEFRVGMTFR
ncbi:MAG: hypothetical protein ACLQVL_24100 [Terriglobia bacterium]